MTSTASNVERRCILITGGANGMGLASARRLAEDGCNLALSDLNRDAGKAAIDTLSQDFPSQKFLFEAVDVSDAEAVERWVASVVQQMGNIHGLLSCAGIAIPSPRLHETNLGHFRKIMDVNLYGTVYVNVAVLAQFLKQNSAGVEAPVGGYTICNMGSKGSVEGLPSATAYTSAKHAVLGLTRTTAKDYAADNIRVNCLCPGLILSDMTRGLMASGKPELSKERLLSQIWAKKFGTIEEMANIVNWLLSSQSAYVTGQAIEADGMWAI